MFRTKFRMNEQEIIDLNRVARKTKNKSEQTGWNMLQRNI